MYDQCGRCGMVHRVTRHFVSGLWVLGIERKCSQPPFGTFEPIQLMALEANGSLDAMRPPRIVNTSGVNCIYCHGKEQWDVTLHSDGDGAFKYMKAGEVCHLECYIQLCLDRAIGSSVPKPLDDADVWS